MPGLYNKVNECFLFVFGDKEYDKHVRKETNLMR